VKGIEHRGEGNFFYAALAELFLLLA